VTATVLETRNLSRAFGAVRALIDVSIELHAGEVLGLLGDNGAGKSTLARCIAGLYLPDSGTILIDGRPVEISTPRIARELGIEAVHQNLALVSQLDVAANLFLNRELVSTNSVLRTLRWLDKKRMQEESDRILERLQIKVPSASTTVDKLSGGQRQAVAIGRAIGWGRHIVLLDEPAAALGVEQSRHVNELIRRLRDGGVALILISHNMQSVIEVCDRAVVLRHGRKVGDVAIQDVSASDLVALITGASRAV
jgi:simple sugar transport system ATP-binding protein